MHHHTTTQSAGSLALVTAPAAEPLDLAQAKLHLRVDDVSEDDGYITALIAAARQTVETWTRRQLITATWRMNLPAFPCGELRLPIAPVQSVGSVKYIDADGVLQTWSSALYQTDLAGEPACVAPIYGEVWPEIQPGTYSAVRVEFTAGHGTAGSDVPAALRQAMLLLLGHWYTNRSEVEVGTIATQIPFAAKALMGQYRWGGWP